MRFLRLECIARPLASSADQKALCLGAVKIRLDWEESLIYLARAIAGTASGRGFSGVPGYAGLML